MFRNNNNRYRNNRSSSFQRGGGSRGGYRTIKSFDPSNIINFPRVQKPTEEYVLTHTFSDFNLGDEIQRNIVAKGYKDPTPIQDQAIIPISEGRDLIGIANTGTGKTAAFLIPLIDRVLKDRNQQILIVVPTRELASQIRDELTGFSRGLGIYSALCIGGANMHRQINDLRRNSNFVIGTPGRLEDLIRSKHLDLSFVNTVILDEADHMVDIGFIQNIKFIISLLPKTRQSLFFSATIDGKVREVLNNFVQNPITVSVKTGDTAENVKQEIIRVKHTNSKVDELRKLLSQKEFDKVLVFGRTKHGVQKVSDELIRWGIKADAIHGNKKQSQRERTLERFKKSEIQVLLATDVASRGLDIPNVSHVVNFDLPESYEAYIHRIGRTGRADKCGVAITFVN